MRDACEPLLPQIAEDADLLDLDRWREPLHELLHAAVQPRDVLIPVATKVLHRKRRGLIPMLDNVVLQHYFRSPEQRTLLAASQSKANAADVAMRALDLFRADLVAVDPALAVRIFEILISGTPGSTL